MTMDLDYLFFGECADLLNALVDAPESLCLDQFEFVETAAADDPLMLAAVGGSAVVLDGAGNPVEVFGLFALVDAAIDPSGTDCDPDVVADSVEDVWLEFGSCFDFI